MKSLFLLASATTALAASKFIKKDFEVEYANGLSKRDIPAQDLDENITLASRRSVSPSQKQLTPPQTNCSISSTGLTWTSAHLLSHSVCNSTLAAVISGFPARVFLNAVNGMVAPVVHSTLQLQTPTASSSLMSSKSSMLMELATLAISSPMLSLLARVESLRT